MRGITLIFIRPVKREKQREILPSSLVLYIFICTTVLVDDGRSRRRRASPRFGRDQRRGTISYGANRRPFVRPTTVFLPLPLFLRSDTISTSTPIVHLTCTAHVCLPFSYNRVRRTHKSPCEYIMYTCRVYYVRTVRVSWVEFVINIILDRVCVCVCVAGIRSRFIFIFFSLNILQYIMCKCEPVELYISLFGSVINTTTTTC